MFRHRRGEAFATPGKTRLDTRPAGSFAAQVGFPDGEIMRIDISPRVCYKKIERRH